LNPLQRLADRRELLLGIDFQLGADLEIGVGLLRATRHLVRQTAVVIDAGIARALIDRRRQKVVRRGVVAPKERVNAAAVQIVEDVLLGFDRPRKTACEDQSYAGAKDRLPGHASDSLSLLISDVLAARVRKTSPASVYDSLLLKRSQAIGGAPQNWDEPVERVLSGPPENGILARCAMRVRIGTAQHREGPPENGILARCASQTLNSPPPPAVLRNGRRAGRRSTVSYG
jgi:hypothetical protein